MLAKDDMIDWTLPFSLSIEEMSALQFDSLNFELHLFGDDVLGGVAPDFFGNADVC